MRDPGNAIYWLCTKCPRANEKYGYKAKKSAERSHSVLIEHMKSMHGNWKDVMSTTAHKEEFVAARANIIRRHEQPVRKRSLERNNEVVEVTGTVAEASLSQTYLNTRVIPEADFPSNTIVKHMKKLS